MNALPKIISLLAVAFLLSSCGTLTHVVPSFEQRKAIAVGSPEPEVVVIARQVVGPPKEETIIYSSKDKADFIKLRRYSFTSESDLVLSFYKGVFIQADLTLPDAQEPLAIRKDYHQVALGLSKPDRIYIIASNGRRSSIKTLLP